MEWISVKDRLPESGERVLVYWYEANIDLHQMALLEYYRKGDTVDNETLRRDGETPEQFLLSLLRGGRGERAVAEDGFYIYGADATTGLCRWRKHADCITHWMPMPDAPDETEDDPETNADKIGNAAYALTKTLESISPAITRLYRLSGLLKMDAPDIIISNEARMALDHMMRVYRDVGDAIRETREVWESTRGEQAASQPERSEG